MHNSDTKLLDVLSYLIYNHGYRLIKDFGEFSLYSPPKYCDGNPAYTFKSSGLREAIQKACTTFNL